MKRTPAGLKTAVQKKVKTLVKRKMLDEKGFDLWADEYDKAVGISDEENTYPFASYRDVLNGIYRTIMEKSGEAVLDIGFGSGGCERGLRPKA
jgi:hypothetical protein